MAESTRRSPTPPEPLPANITSAQPGYGAIMRLELAWGRCRRWLLRRVRPGHVRRWAARRQGECPGCTHDVIDPRDLKFFSNCCGYHFGTAHDPYAWRGRLGIARMGWAEVWVFSLPWLAAAVALGCAWSPWCALPPLLPALFVWSFFRDPARRAPAEPGLVVAAGDGRVTDITELEQHEFVAGPAWCVGVFLSLLNVHVNRSPVRARLIGLRYAPGLFLDARSPRCASENESMTILLEQEGGRRFLLRQVSGKVARRIVFWLRPGDWLERGERFGMIKFGSRAEIVLPRTPGACVTVAVGDQVTAGTTIVARYPTEG